MVGSDGDAGVEGEGTLPGHLHLGPAHVLLLEQELPVQVAHFNRIKVNL